MKLLRASLFYLLVCTGYSATAQNDKYIATSEEFILENVRGYKSIEERALEHEEFNVLVFEDEGRELSFYFTFFKGAKVCSYIKNAAPLNDLKEELDYIKSNFTNTSTDVWKNASKSVEVQIKVREGRGVILTKQLHNF